MGHVSANNSSANDKFFLAGHGDLPSVQPNCYGHRVSSFMSCNLARDLICSPPHHREDHLRLAGVATYGGSAWMLELVDIMLRTYHCSCDRRASRPPGGPKGEAIAVHKEGQHHGDFLR
jgi:hypothetical protein